MDRLTGRPPAGVFQGAAGKDANQLAPEVRRPAQIVDGGTFSRSGLAGLPAERISLAVTNVSAETVYFSIASCGVGGGVLRGLTWGFVPSRTCWLFPRSWNEQYLPYGCVRLIPATGGALRRVQRGAAGR